MKIHQHLVTSMRHIAVASVLIVSATSAFAHTSLQSAIPAVDSTVTAQPNKLVVSFGEPVMLMGIKLIDAKQNNIELNYKVTSGLKNTYEITIPQLADSTYTVVWTSMGKDGHNMSGKYNFSLKQSAQTTSNKTSSVMPNKKSPAMPTMMHHNHSQH